MGQLTGHPRRVIAELICMITQVSQQTEALVHTAAVVGWGPWGRHTAGVEEHARRRAGDRVDRSHQAHYGSVDDRTFVLHAENGRGNVTPHNLVVSEVGFFLGPAKECRSDYGRGGAVVRVVWMTKGKLGGVLVILPLLCVKSSLLYTNLNAVCELSASMRGSTPRAVPRSGADKQQQQPHDEQQ